MVKFINAKNLTPFPCTACGLCCLHVHKSEQTAFLDRGDGTCWHFDEDTNLCTIYDDRPLVCRVEAYYQAYLSEVYDWQVFIEMNVAMCQQLQQENAPKVNI